MSHKAEDAAENADDAETTNSSLQLDCAPELEALLKG